MIYNLTTEVNNFIDEFGKSIDVVSMPQLQNIKKKRTKYSYNQRETLARIDMAVLSQFETGQFDQDGQRKLYLNIVNFMVDVANKSTDLDTRHFVFSPEDYDQSTIWGTWLIARQFKNYIKETGLAEVMNEITNSFNRYGSAVIKCYYESDERELEIVPIQTIINDQSASSLEDGIEKGGFVILEHSYGFGEIEEYPQWKRPKRYKGTKTVYEVYGKIPKSALENGVGNEDDDYVLVMAILMEGEKEPLFIEEIERLPLKEIHDRRILGRWLGVGEVEKQFDNQIAQNLAVNLQRRSMLWASKKIFQTKGSSVPKSLTSAVEDGEVLQIDMNGDIMQVDLSTRASNDYQQAMNIWGDNSRQISFTFEAQTGEAMPSGQPFRLGALLSNASQGYFNLKKQKLGLFWIDVFWDLILPTFKKSIKKDFEIISSSEQGYSNIKDLMVEAKTSEYFKNYFLSEDAFKFAQPTEEEVRAKIEQELLKAPFLTITDLTKKFYKDIEYKINLDLTGESVNMADRETMITLYTALSQKGDPRADRVLEVIFGTMGKNLQAIAGKTQTAPAQMTPTPAVQGTAGNPNLQGLVPQE